MKVLEEEVGVEILVVKDKYVGDFLEGFVLFELFVWEFRILFFLVVLISFESFGRIV